MPRARLHLNEPPCSPPPRAVELAARYCGEAGKYYVEGLAERLRARLAEYAGVREDRVMLLPGAMHGIQLFLALARARGWEVALPHPTFHEVYRLADAMGVRLRPVRLGPGFSLDPGELLRAARGRAVYLANPNNPTGNLLFEGEGLVEELAGEAEAVLVDEAYYEFSGATAKGAAEREPNVAVLRSMSKAFCLAGFRVGYAIAGERVKAWMEGLMGGYDVAVPSLAAALGALEEVERARALVAEVERLREEARSRLESMGLRVYGSRANFLLVHLGEPCKRVAECLGSMGVLVACPGESPWLPELRDYMRVSVRGPEEMEALFEALGRCLGRLRQRS